MPGSGRTGSIIGPSGNSYSSGLIFINGESSIRVRPPVLRPESDFTDYTLTEDSFLCNEIGHYKYKQII